MLVDDADHAAAVAEGEQFLAMTTIFFGGPSASGNSSDSRTGSQNRRSNSPIPVPAPLSVRKRLSSARSMVSSGVID
jgi:hypothetical protein